MNKIKEAVKQKLFSPSILGNSSTSSSKGVGGAGGTSASCSGYQELLKLNSMKVSSGRRCVLSNADNEKDDSESDSNCQQMDEDGDRDL